MFQFSLIFMTPAWYTKLCKNQMFQFSLIFITPGTWNFTQIWCFSFLYFLWPWYMKLPQKKDTSFFFSNFHDPEYVKLQKNQMFPFSPIFMTRYMKLPKNQMFHFRENFHDPGQVHETSQKSDVSIFSNFYDPGYTKLLFFSNLDVTLKPHDGRWRWILNQFSVTSFSQYS